MTETDPASTAERLAAPEAVAAPGSAPGQELLGGRLLVVRPMGTGAFGRVFAARDKELGRLVLAKLVGSRGEQRNRMRRGHARLRKLDHPHIARVLDLRETNEGDVVLTEFIDGCNLGALQAHTIGEYHCLRIFLEQAHALRYAHDAGLLHRDIKPTNVLVERLTGRSYLTDFDIAKPLDDDDPITVEWTFVGTPVFAPPEVLSGERWHGVDSGVRADVYSFGATLYSFLAGKPLFRSNDPLSVLHQVMQGARGVAARDESISKHVPPDVRRLIDRALSVGANERPGMDEVVSVLERAKASLPPTGWNPAWVGQSGPVIDVALTMVAETIPRLPAMPRAATEASIATSRSFESIERSLEFYVENLSLEYEDARARLRTCHRLWTACVSVGFGVIVVGVVLLLLGQTAAGASSAASSTIAYFIQKTILGRERDLKEDAESKRHQMEAGAHWIRLMQAIELIEDPAVREKRKAKLIDVLIGQMGPRLAAG